MENGAHSWQLSTEPSTTSGLEVLSDMEGYPACGGGCASWAMTADARSAWVRCFVGTPQWVCIQVVHGSNPCTPHRGGGFKEGDGKRQVCSDVPGVPQS